MSKLVRNSVTFRLMGFLFSSEAPSGANDQFAAGVPARAPGAELGAPRVFEPFQPPCRCSSSTDEVCAKCALSVRAHGAEKPSRRSGVGTKPHRIEYPAGVTPRKRTEQQRLLEES